jgi:hypothetical protein
VPFCKLIAVASFGGLVGLVTCSGKEIVLGVNLYNLVI